MNLENQVKVYSSVAEFISEIKFFDDSTLPFFLRPIWFLNFEKFVCANHNKIKVIAAFDKDDDLLFFLPLFEHTETIGLCYEKREFSSLSNYYTPYFNLVVTTNSDEQFFEMAFKAILELKKDFNFQSVILTPMFREDVSVWINLACESGLLPITDNYSTNWYNDEIVNSSKFWAARPKKLLNTIKRKKHKIDSLGTFSTVFYKDAKDLPKLLADYHRVYYESWKRQESHPAFIDAITKDASARNELRLAVMYDGGTPVAAQIWFLHKDTAYIFKLAHDKEYGKLSVGTILTAEMFDWVIGLDAVKKVDFMTGNDNYKVDWMSDKKELVALQIVDPMSLYGSAVQMKLKLKKHKVK